MAGVVEHDELGPRPGAGAAIPGNSAAARERRLHAVAAAVGGLGLARASDDARLAQEILSAVRRRILDDNRQA